MFFPGLSPEPLGAKASNILTGQPDIDEAVVFHLFEHRQLRGTIEAPADPEEHPPQRARAMNGSCAKAGWLVDGGHDGFLVEDSNIAVE